MSGDEAAETPDPPVPDLTKKQAPEPAAEAPAAPVREEPRGLDDLPMRQLLARVASPVLTIIGAAILVMTALSTTWFRDDVILGVYDATTNPPKFIQLFPELQSASHDFLGLRKITSGPLLFNLYFDWLFFALTFGVVALALAANIRWAHRFWIRATAVLLALGASSLTLIAAQQARRQAELDVLNVLVGGNDKVILMTNAALVHASLGVWLAVVGFTLVAIGAAAGSWLPLPFGRNEEPEPAVEPAGTPS